MTNSLSGKKLSARRSKSKANAPELERHIVLVGEVTFAWSQFQSGLFSIFFALLDKDHKLAHGLWHCIRSDGTQRDMLIAAAEAKLAGQKALLKQVIWLAECGSKLAAHRNDLTHTAMLNWPNLEKNTYQAVPDFIAGRKAAVGRLLTTDPRAWEHVAGDLRALYAYAMLLGVRIMGRGRKPSWSWPDRPKLRSISATRKSGNARRRSRKPTTPQRPPRSSRA